MAVARGRLIGEIGGGGRQHFARQGQIDRTLGLAHGQIEGAVDRVLQHMAIGKLIVPLHEFAHHGALIAHFLRPVDLAGALAQLAAVFGEGRAARAEEHGDIAAPGVHDAADRIGGADIHMHHHKLRLAGLEVIAHGHGHGHVLMGHGDGLGDLGPIGFGLGIGLDQGREIRARVGEEIINAAIRQQGQIGVRHGSIDGLLSHGVSPLMRLIWAHAYTAQTAGATLGKRPGVSRATSSSCAPEGSAIRPRPRSPWRRRRSPWAHGSPCHRPPAPCR